MFVFFQFPDYRPNIKHALEKERTRRSDKQVEALELRVLFLRLCFAAGVVAWGGHQSVLLQTALGFPEAVEAGAVGVGVRCR